MTAVCHGEREHAVQCGTALSQVVAGGPEGVQNGRTVAATVSMGETRKNIMKKKISLKINRIITVLSGLLFLVLNLFLIFLNYFKILFLFNF